MGFWDVDYSKLDFIKKMNGEYNTDINSKEHVSLDSNSTDEDILDYIILYLCSNLERIPNVYKGGYVLMKVLPEVARYSKDIDFSIGSGSNYEDIKDILVSLSEELISLGVINNYTLKDTITPTMSGGIKFHRIDKVDLGIDIGWHDISYGIIDWEFKGINIKRFSVERMLSDKISAIYSTKRFRRTKDLYDVYILYKSFDIDYLKLGEYIQRRGTIDWNKTPFTEIVLREYAKAYDKLNIINSVNDNILKPTFKQCIDVLKIIVKELGKDDTIKGICEG